MTLPQFYDAYVLPICRVSRGADTKTIAVDRTALRYWHELTRDPSLEDLDEYDCSDFVERSTQLPGRQGKLASPNTIRKHCTHLQYILDRAGPRSRRVRNAARLIPEPPGFDRPRPRKRACPELLSLVEIGAWLLACQEATSPARIERVSPPVWWRALVIFAYNTGLRIDTIMELRWPMLNQAGWLEVPAEIFKGGDHGGVFYVNAAGRKAIEPLRKWGHEKIFPWAHWPKSSSYLHKQRRRLWRRAHIDRPGNGFHGLRRALLTWLSGRNDLIARFVAGHAAGNDILQGHYVDHRQIVVELLEQVPQPRARRKGARDQMYLPGFG
jgi:integrase